MVRIEKTHAKNQAGLYKAGEVYEEKDVEHLAYKLENGYAKRIKTATKEEKKVSKRKTK